MKIVLLFIVAVALSCQSNGIGTRSAERTELAIITGNSLASDGCEEFIRLDTGNSTVSPTRYKPTPATLPLLQNALAAMTPAQRYQGERPVKIRFYETGRQVYIQCGWGSRLDVDEVEILSITDR